MRHFLVTGGAGFIGSHLVRALVDRGDRARVLDNFMTGKRENLAEVADAIELMEDDLRNPEACRRACEGIDIVFHEGALPSVPKSVADPVASHEANVDGTFNILMAARDAGVKRLVYAASSSAYGDAPTLPKVEDMPPCPLSPYAVNKLVGEYYCKTFYDSFGLQTLSFRYFNVFGPRQDPASQYAAAVPAFATAILHDEPVTVHGDGEQSRDFTYIDNVIDANFLAADADETHGEVLNIACGERVTINQVVAAINKALGKSVPSNHVEPRPGDVRHSLADIEAARRVIGYEPKVRFEEGLALAIDWYKQNLA